MKQDFLGTDPADNFIDGEVQAIIALQFGCDGFSQGLAASRCAVSGSAPAQAVDGDFDDGFRR